jgi:uncharacterized protein YqhQ
VPFVRGVASLVESMSLGMKALSWAAQRSAGDDDDQPVLGKGAVAGTMVFALLFFTGLFVLLPALMAKAAGHWVHGGIGFNALEGGIKLGLFLGYLLLLGRIPDIAKVFSYHGAEHKAIAAFENGVELTPESAQRFTTRHVRCGTNFLLLVLVLSIVAHTFFGRPGWAVLMASRVLLIPVVAGVAFELIRIGAKHFDKPLVRMLMQPGLALQKLTTREPELDQLEVALAALRAALTPEQLVEVSARVPTAA